MKGTNRVRPESSETRSRSSGAAGAPLLLLGFVLLAGFGFVVYLLVARGAAERERVSEGSGGGSGQNEFAYDIKGLLAVDPSLITHDEVLSFDIGFREPRGIDVGEGDTVFVVGDSALRGYYPDGRSMTEVELPAPPQCVDESPAGHYHVGFRDHVEVYDSKSKLRIASWESLGKTAVVTSIAIWKNDVYVADAGQRVVWHYDLSGKRVGEIGRKDAARDIPGFIVPSPFLDLAVGPDGRIRVVNPGRHRIEAYSREGDLDFFWGKPSMGIEGFSGCCNPCNIALLPAGGYVTCEKGIPRVKVYDESGTLVGVVADPKRFVAGERALEEDWRRGTGGGLDVAVDSKGRILVLDPMGRNVRVFAKKKTT